MKTKRYGVAAIALAAAGALVLTGCTSGGSEPSAPAGDPEAIITTNGSEPQNPLIPTNTTETGGGKIVTLSMTATDRVFEYAACQSTVKAASAMRAGSPSKCSCAVRLRESLYTSPHRNGFMRLDIMRGGGVLLRVFRFTSSGSGGIAYSHWLEPRP